MIRDDRWRDKAGELEPTVAVGRAHHGNLDALIAQSSDTSGPFSFDRGPPFKLKATVAKKINRRRKVIDDDTYVVHRLERHVSNLQTVVSSDNGRRPNREKPLTNALRSKACRRSKHGAAGPPAREIAGDLLASFPTTR